MEPIDPQSTINPKPKKVVPIGPPKPRRDMRFIDGKIRIVEVIGDKVVRVIGEKKNPYKDITKQYQGTQKDENATTSLVPLPDGGISTLSAIKAETKTDDIINIKSGQDVLDISVLRGAPKTENGVADTNKEKTDVNTPKETLLIEQNVPKEEIKEKETARYEIKDLNILAQERDKKLADLQIEFEERTKKKTKEEVVKKEPISHANTVANQSFLSGTGSTMSDILNRPTIEKKDVKDTNIQEHKPEAKPEVRKETIKEKEDIKTQPVINVIPVGIGNLAAKLDLKAKELTKKIIENAKSNKDTIKEAKRMGDEKLTQTDEELISRGVEKKLKDMNFKKSIEDSVKFAGESRTKLTDLHKEIGDIEDKVGTIGKSVGEMCEGVDCIKKDFKGAQERQTEFEKQVANGLQALADKVQKLERPSYVCDNCGEDAINALSSYCPNCGNPIPNWTGEDGHPVPGWRPYWVRLKEARIS